MSLPELYPRLAAGSSSSSGKYADKAQQRSWGKTEMMTGEKEDGEKDDEEVPCDPWSENSLSGSPCHRMRHLFSSFFFTLSLSHRPVPTTLRACGNPRSQSSVPNCTFFRFRRKLLMRFAGTSGTPLPLKDLAFLVCRHDFYSSHS